MGRSKLKVLHVGIIGTVLALIIVAVAFFAFIKPTQATIEEKKGELSGLQQKAQALGNNQTALVKARLDSAQAKSDLAQYESKYMRVGPTRQVLDFQGANGRVTAMLALWREQAETLGPVLERYMNRAGVKLLSPIAVPAAPTDPNVINPSEIKLDFPGIQVMGTWGNIMAFLRSMETFPRLVLINNVTLSGSSPLVTAAIDLSVIILPRNGDKAQIVPSVTSDQTGMGGGVGAPGSYGPTPMGPTPGGGPGVSNGAAVPSNGAAAPSNGATGAPG
ncbi:MAG TPA: hypothetical protein VGN26_09295 [Armatimonadota bacterium]